MGELGRSHFRGKARTGRRIELSYRVDEPGMPGGYLTAFTKNIGVGGAFILSTDPAPPGTKLKVRIQLPAASLSSVQLLEVAAEVRWIVDGEGQAARDHGMGVRFDGIDVEHLLVLHEYFSGIETVDHDEG